MSNVNGESELFINGLSEGSVKADCQVIYRIYLDNGESNNGNNKSNGSSSSFTSFLSQTLVETISNADPSILPVDKSSLLIGEIKTSIYLVFFLVIFTIIKSIKLENYFKAFVERVLDESSPSSTTQKQVTSSIVMSKSSSTQMNNIEYATSSLTGFFFFQNFLSNYIFSNAKYMFNILYLLIYN